MCRWCVDVVWLVCGCSVAGVWMKCGWCVEYGWCVDGVWM